MASKCACCYGWELGFKKKSPYLEKNVERVCYSCKMKLFYSAFFNLNRTHFTEESLRKIWNDRRVELYCCNCFELKLALNPPKKTEVLFHEMLRQDTQKLTKELSEFMNSWKDHLENKIR